MDWGKCEFASGNNMEDHWQKEKLLNKLSQEEYMCYQQQL